MLTIDFDYVKAALPPRDPAGHKGDFGKVYVLGGSVGYTGAPVFCSRAAVRSGCGLVFLGVPSDIWQVAAVKSDETMPHPLPTLEGRLSLAAEEAVRRRAAGCDVIALGCGLGRGAESDALVRRLLTLDKPLVLDADGINALERHIDELSLRRGQVTPDGRLAVNTTGNDGMAKGGSGDILTGLAAGLLAQGMEPFAACCCAVWLHGRAGDLAAADKGRRGMTPSDLLEKLPYALKEVE